MGTPDHSDVGYPEEQPDEVTPDEGTDPETAADPDRAADRAPDNDDGQATGGNP
jgi:hypothetical protein